MSWTSPMYAGDQPSQQSTRNATTEFFMRNDGHRIDTATAFTKVLQNQYPQLSLSVVNTYTANLTGFAAAGKASMIQIQDDTSDLPKSLQEKVYIPSPRRLDGGSGILAVSYQFAKFQYTWEKYDFIVYVADVFQEPYSTSTKFFILSARESDANALIRAVGQWNSQLHGEILIFEGGRWMTSKELFQSVMKASWDAVILDKDMKKALIEDHLSFFRSEATYKRLKVPWKRGIIYHGPPGNGKTISIKAMMHMLYEESTEIPTLYVRSLRSFFGPEDSVKQIFQQARRFAPCYLVFEDLDTIVSDDVRSYFLNEVDGLKSNDGIFMIGSTNHLDRLDPGISQRPSRFDRKYLFPDPNYNERVAYCEFWQKKLASNKDIDFPDKLCEAIANITDHFSFAYMQEAFVAALLAIARSSTGTDEMAHKMGVLTVELKDDWIGVIGKSEDNDSLDDNVLWVEIQKQIEILRQGMAEDPEK